MRYSQFVKAQAAAAIGTAIDFVVTIGCVEVLHSWYLLATALGNAAGGLTNFYLGRYLVFKVSQPRIRQQGIRYFLVWLGSMLLNAAGVWLFTQQLHVNYLCSKIVVSLVVGIGFNYFLQLHFVFRKL